MPNVYDIVILGGGSGGYAAALRADQLGLSVAIVEKGKLGGTCLHNGCIPTKALLHSAEVADAARESESFGVKASFEGIDMKGVNAFKAGVVERLYKGLQGLLASSESLTIIEGEGKLVSTDENGGGTVEVNGEKYTGRNVILATGSAPRTLGLDIGGRIVTSDEALEMSEVPERVVIIGGSVIGVEFASIWKSFGADVTIIEAMKTLVPLEDPSLSKQLERAFRKRKIAFRTGVKFTSVEQTDSGAIVSLENGDTIDTDVVLVAVGRGPRSEGFGFEEAGVTVDRGWVPTDERLRTNVEGVFAVGDLVPGLQLAHRSFAHGIFVAEEIAGLDPQPIIDVNVPRVTYCEPELASVGITEPQAVERYGEDNVDIVEYNLGGNGKSQILQTAGIVKLVREKDGPIVGVHMIGSRFGEQVGEASLIVNWEAYPEDVAAFIHAHPTQNESLGEAALALANRPLHSHN
ncbi:MAG: dihydrolipoyl dehydrogenase [Rhodococcus sp. (in: high G+C Gram-positive bacteria)]|uniref:dihydrolipoyl dehydrogenase n=1 Tax=Rhodococcus sp. EPR-157 TaxID=1813677 RepID=UPI0007BB3C0E|nr:dihydrolipoyl dehydrogenase [Rhodococcus sp. EPR-157]KZF03942.1 dihydrolipoyl dehydrogenase [Rhodococcus sp. EPR-157]